MPYDYTPARGTAHYTMDDLEDVFEVFDDVEDVVEDFADPEDLVEDLVENTLLVVGVVVAVVAAGVFLLGLLFIAAAFLLAGGIVPVLVVLVVLALVAGVAGLGAVVYAHTSVSKDARRKIDDALERADDGDHEDDGGLTEQEAIERLREQYASDDITHEELERRIEAVFEADDPERVVHGHYDRDDYRREDDYDREYDYDR